MRGFIRGGVRGFIRGACVVLSGGVFVCVVLFGGCAWFYSGGACMVLSGGGACVVFPVFSDTMRYGQ